MNWLLKAFSCVIASCVLFSSSLGLNSLQADTFDVDAEQVGGFFEVGAPDNLPVFQNYFTGFGSSGPTPLPERRPFFLFELPPLLPGEVVVSADFSIYLPDFGVPANFTGGIEIFAATSTSSTVAEILDPAGEGVPPEDIFDTFGTGDFYGDLVFELASPPPGPFPMELIMPLTPTAVGDIGSSMGGDFVMTGIMATADLIPPALDEIIFSLSDLVVGGTPTGLPFPFLSITTVIVPEPSSVVLALMGLALLVVGRRSR